MTHAVRRGRATHPASSLETRADLTELIIRSLELPSEKISVLHSFVETVAEIESRDGADAALAYIDRRHRQLLTELGVASA